MLYIISFFIVIVVYLLYTSYSYQEHFTINKNAGQTNNKERNVILLGDSILKNNNFVKEIDSIEYILRQKSSNNIYCLAEDGATIEDVYKQIDAIPLALNNDKNIIFLSIGGNNILKNRNIDIDMLFQRYKRLLSELQVKFNKCKIVFFNLYTPPNINKLKKDDTLSERIKDWNNALSEFSDNLKSQNVELINLHSLLYKPTDFVSDYEPSESGGYKIVTAILHKSFFI